MSMAGETRNFLGLVVGGALALVLLAGTFLHGIVSVARPAGSSPFMPKPQARPVARQLSPEEIERVRARIRQRQAERRAAELSNPRGGR